MQAYLEAVYLNIAKSRTQRGKPMPDFNLWLAECERLGEAQRKLKLGR